MRADEIFVRLQKSRSLSKRGVYKELLSLTKQGVLVRVKGYYAVKLTWIQDIEKLGQDLSKQTLHPDNLKYQIPNIGEKVVWKFRDLRKLDAFWEQLVFILYALSPTKKCMHGVLIFGFIFLILKKRFRF